MLEQFESFYGGGAVLVMWAALLFHLLLPIPKAVHPITLFNRFALLVSDKVNNSKDFNYSRFSGALAWAVLVVPFVILLVAIKPLVWQPQLFDLALLLFAIEWRRTETTNKLVINALEKQNKKAAREALDPHLNRQTSTLSPLGLGKACAETSILGYGRNVICVLFWFAIGGGIAALTYRVIAELARVWSPSRSQFRPFGFVAVVINTVAEIIPLRLFALLITTGRNGVRTVKGIAQESNKWVSTGTSWLLLACAYKLELSLGGPAIYNNVKIERAKIGGRIAPAAFHLAQLQHLLVWRIFVWLTLQSLILFWINNGI